jgi:UDP-glucose 4-epimerase
MFKRKNILITGGTGSFGNAFLSAITKKFDFGEIRILSRDEKKQDDMRKKFKNKKIKFFLGDVRDKSSIKNSIQGVNFIFHAAALKQVPSCEFFPLEAVKTNILGTSNVLDCAIEYGVEKVVCLSTDKAVYPINAMGISKALMEKVIISKVRSLYKNSRTKICITRYGNVIGSRGSVIPLFLNQIKNNKPLTITDLKMTRFVMLMKDAIDLVLFAFKNGNNGDILIKKSPSSTINTIVKSFELLYGKNKVKTKFIGVRHGEKLHETLMSTEEKYKAKSFTNYFSIPYDERDLNYDKYYIQGNKFKEVKDYTSENTHYLNAQQVKKIILDFSKSYFEK